MLQMISKGCLAGLGSSPKRLPSSPMGIKRAPLATVACSLGSRMSITTAEEASSAARASSKVTEGADALAVQPNSSRLALAS